MSEYYAIQRSDEYLEHYGVKGMKWHVRKALAKGDDKALGRQYKKAAKKLAKLEKRGANGKKYAKRAGRLAVGATAALGAGAHIHQINKAANRMGGLIGWNSPVRGDRKLGQKVWNVTKKVGDWADKPLTIAGKTPKIGGHSVTRGGAVRLGLLGAGAGMAAGAGYNAYRAATAGRNRKKAAAFRSEMQKTFKGTKYEHGMPAKQTTARHGKKRKR